MSSTPVEIAAITEYFSQLTFSALLVCGLWKLVSNWIPVFLEQVSPIICSINPEKGQMQASLPYISSFCPVCCNAMCLIICIGSLSVRQMNNQCQFQPLQECYVVDSCTYILRWYRNLDWLESAPQTVSFLLWPFLWLFRSTSPVVKSFWHTS